MSSIDVRRPSLIGIGLALALLAGCAGAPKKPAKDVDNVNVVKSVRSQPAAPVAAASDTTHVTTVSATTAVQVSAQAAIKDYFAGVQMMKGGKLDDALVMFQQLSAQHPMLSGPLVNQALVLYRQDKWDDSLAIVEQALKINERNPFAWNLRGLIMRQKGKFADAREAYQRALLIDGNYAKAHFNLGILADLYLQDLELALRHYETYQTLQRKPDPAVTNWVNDLRNRLGIVAPAAAPAAPAAPSDSGAPSTDSPPATAPAPETAPAPATAG
jgi:tetratricopeptide (TPR) repeat protein